MIFFSDIILKSEIQFQRPGLSKTSLKRIIFIIFIFNNFYVTVKDALNCFISKYSSEIFFMFKKISLGPVFWKKLFFDGRGETFSPNFRIVSHKWNSPLIQIELVITWKRINRALAMGNWNACTSRILRNKSCSVVEQKVFFLWIYRCLQIDLRH